MHNAFGFARCAGRVDDLHNVVAVDSGQLQWSGRRKLPDFIERDPAHGNPVSLDRLAVDEQRRTRFMVNAESKFSGESIIDRNYLSAPSNRAPKCHNPFEPVFAPDEDTIAFAYAC